MTHAELADLIDRFIEHVRAFLELHDLLTSGADPDLSQAEAILESLDGVGRWGMTAQESRRLGMLIDIDAKTAQERAALHVEGRRLAACLTAEGDDCRPLYKLLAELDRDGDGPKTARPIFKKLRPPLEQRADALRACSGPAAAVKRWAWDLYPLARRAWENQEIPDDGTPAGQTIKLRKTYPKRKCGHYLNSGDSIYRNALTVNRPGYLPTDDDLALLKWCRPKDDPFNPQWRNIGADVKASGYAGDGLDKADVPELLRLLAKVKTASAAPSPDDDRPGAAHLAALGFPVEIASLLDCGEFPRLDDDEFAKLGAWLSGAGRSRANQMPLPTLDEMRRQTGPALDTPEKQAQARRANAVQRLRTIQQYNVNLAARAAPAPPPAPAVMPAQAQNAEGSAQAGDATGRPTGSGDTSAKADRKIAREWAKWRDAQITAGNHTASFAQYAKQKYRAELAKLDPRDRPAAVKQYASRIKAAVDRDRKRTAARAKRTSK